MLSKLARSVFAAASFLAVYSAFVTARPDFGSPETSGAEGGTAALATRSGLSADPQIGDGDPRTLELCECEPAQGSPSGLSCEKEGWFISAFEQAGQWLDGGGFVPLSRAICCRPCIPTELPGAPNTTTAVAVVSFGCHPSSNPDAASLRCEASGGSFVTSWSDAIRVPNSAQYFYPVGAAYCCTPSLLLSTGETRELERCDCVQQDDINCKGTSSHRLLAGYLNFGRSQFGEYVPIAPSLCCKSCITDREIPADSCYDLNFCSGHGVCNLGACECAEGYGGSDCKHRVAIQHDGLPNWMIAVIIVSSCITFCIFILALGRVLRHYAAQQGSADGDDSEEGDELREPLIVGLASDDEGSVGSVDSSDADEDDANMPPPISRAPASGCQGIPFSHSCEENRGPKERILLAGRPQPEEQEAVGGGIPVQPETEQPASRAEPFEISHEASERAEGPPQDAETDAAIASIQADEVIIEGIRRAEAMHHQQEEDASGSSPEDETLKQSVQDGPVKDLCKDRGGVPGIDCSVCFSRPVQVAVVPCGHMCMCRRCSRRLAMCPVCRSRILRRQRIFVGG